MSFISWLYNHLSPETINARKLLKRYSQVGHQVFVVLQELRDCNNPRAHAYIQAAQSLLVIADAMLGLRFANTDQDIRLTPQIRRLVDQWYRRIPELLIAARQEAVYPNTAVHDFPVELGDHLKPPHGKQSAAYLTALHRALSGMDQLLRERVNRARTDPETFKTALLLYEAARTSRQSGDLLAASTNGKRALKQSRYDAVQHYLRALPRYFLVAQSLEDPKPINRLAASQFRTCKLDSNDPWKASGDGAKEFFQKSDLYDSTEERLSAYWENRGFSQDERVLECTIEQLEAWGLIIGNGWWTDFPYPGTYEVLAESIVIGGKRLFKGNEFVYYYGEENEEAEWIIDEEGFQDADDDEEEENKDEDEEFENDDKEND